MSKNIDLVIARYKENIDWLYNIAQMQSIRDIYIYEKFDHTDRKLWDTKYIPISLPNIGRESNTYLHHIVQNYDRLNQYTVFLQGDPFPHASNLEDKLFSISKYGIKTTYALNNIEVEHENHRYRYHPPHSHGLFLAYFMDILFDINLDTNQTVEVSYGAQFCVPKDIILSRPLQFYKYLLKIVSRKTMSVEPYIFERLWLYIFNPKINISDTYKQWITD